MDRLIKDAHLLVGKQVRHQCIDPDGTARWFNGKVMGVEPFASEDANLVTKFVIHYEEDQLGEDEPSEEIFPLLVDLKKSDLIIVDKL